MDGGSPGSPSAVSLEELEAQITELAGHLNAAQYRWLTLIAEFDRRRGWSDGQAYNDRAGDDADVSAETSASAWEADSSIAACSGHFSRRSSSTVPI